MNRYITLIIATILLAACASDGPQQKFNKDLADFDHQSGSSAGVVGKRVKTCPPGFELKELPEVAISASAATSMDPGDGVETQANASASGGSTCVLKE